MGYDRARECRRSTEVNGRGFRNTDMDHYTTARFKGMKEEGKGDGRGLPGVKAGSRMYKSRRPGKVFDKSGRWTEDGSQVRRPEYSDVGGSVKTTENDGKPNNVNNQSKTFYSNGREPERSGEDRNVKPEEDGDERMITGSHPVVVQMSSGIEPEHLDDRKVSPEVTKGVRWMRPENPDVKEDRRLRPDEPDAEAKSHVWRRNCRRAISRERPERERGPENGSLNSRMEEERQRKLLKAEVKMPHQRRKFEPEDERHPGSRGLSRKRLTCAGVRVGDPANTEGMNEGGRKPEVQRKSRKKAKLKVTISDERTSPIARPEVVGEIVAELFRSRNLLHVCSTVEPKRTEVTERRAGNAETRVEGGDATSCVFATGSISANRKIRVGDYAGRKAGVMKPGMNGEGKESGTEIASPNVVSDICRESAGQCRRAEMKPDSRKRSSWRRDRKWMVIFPSTIVGARKPGSSSGNRNGRKGEGKPDGMPEQLPEDGTEDAGKCIPEGEDKESGGKDSGSGGRYFALQSNSWNTGTETVTGIVTDIARAPETSGMAEVQGYAGYVKSEKDRPGGESEVDFTRRKFAGTIRNEPENSDEFDRNTDGKMADKPEEPIVPEVVSANLLEKSRGRSELVKGPEEDELAE
ncbi:hypothetical protein K438DRAFT_1948004 [Mycena galopus ATCC 62051]|nr:hypothetical protein K438DRAFT_1948004 [Mycena galopus ATCC 62051]